MQVSTLTAGLACATASVLAGLVIAVSAAHAQSAPVNESCTVALQRLSQWLDQIAPAAERDTDQYNACRRHGKDLEKDLQAAKTAQPGADPSALGVRLERAQQVAEQLVRARLPPMISGCESVQIEFNESGSLSLRGAVRDPDAVRRALLPLDPQPHALVDLSGLVPSGKCGATIGAYVVNGDDGRPKHFPQSELAESMKERVPPPDECEKLGSSIDQAAGDPSTRSAGVPMNWVVLDSFWVYGPRPHNGAPGWQVCGRHEAGQDWSVSENLEHVPRSLLERRTP